MARKKGLVLLLIVGLLLFLSTGCRTEGALSPHVLPVVSEGGGISDLTVTDEAGFSKMHMTHLSPLIAKK